MSMRRATGALLKRLLCAGILAASGACSPLNRFTVLDPSRPL
ncbi:hypothetical protein ACI2J9_16175 [Pseudomonas fulva]|nr:hypothetical protein [Pseudomonas putida]